jgi:hypothetical protein
MAQSRTASLDFTVPTRFRIVEKTRQLTQHLFDTYRPELHYMRGPGPKWRAKHGQPSAQADIGQLELPGLWTARV